MGSVTTDDRLGSRENGVIRNGSEMALVVCYRGYGTSDVFLFHRDRFLRYPISSDWLCHHAPSHHRGTHPSPPIQPHTHLIAILLGHMQCPPIKTRKCAG